MLTEQQLAAVAIELGILVRADDFAPLLRIVNTALLAERARCEAQIASERAVSRAWIVMHFKNCTPERCDFGDQACPVRGEE